MIRILLSQIISSSDLIIERIKMKLLMGLKDNSSFPEVYNLGNFNAS